MVFPYLLKAAKCGTFGTPLLQLEEEDKNTICRQVNLSSIYNMKKYIANESRYRKLESPDTVN